MFIAAASVTMDLLTSVFVMPMTPVVSIKAIEWIVEIAGHN